MNLLDILLGAVVLYCLVRGIFRGIAKELSSIVGALGGLYAAYTYYPIVAVRLSRWLHDPAYLNIASCLLLFFGVYFVVSMLGVLIKYFLNIVFLGWADRLCGALFGSVKGLLISAVLIIVLTAFLPKNAAIVRESLVARYMARVNTTLVIAASRDMKKLFSGKMKELHKTWNGKKL